MLLTKDSANDISASIVESVKQESHSFDSSSLEVSLPTSIAENKQAIWTYSSEPWFLENSLPMSISVKDVLKLSDYRFIGKFVSVYSMGEAPLIEPEAVFAYKFTEVSGSYTERDVVLYALGIGACSTDALDTNELKYVYHPDGQKLVQVLPTFAAIFCHGFDSELLQIPGLPFDPKLLLHGEQYIEIYKPLPSNAHFRSKGSFSGLHDKGKGATIELEILTYHKETSELLCMNRMTIFLRGAGGFSKSSTPYSFTKDPASKNSAVKVPEIQPFAVHEEQTHPSQALLYRLSGDSNSLHLDPMIAKAAGFSRPILHGLCTLGLAVKAIIKCICKGDPSLIKTISNRFLLHVYPGETLITEMWLEGLRVVFQVKVKERKRVVLSGFVDITRLSSSL